MSEKRKKITENKKKKAREQKLKGINPSEEEMTNLLQNYQNRRYDDAENLALSMTQEFAKHQFGWSILGATLKNIGRISESLAVFQKCVQLAPLNAVAHSNLGSLLKELGRLDEAEASFRQAIELKPDFVEAHNNLGVTLQELGRLEEAEASYMQAMALKPNNAEAMLNLSISLSYTNKLEAEIRTLQNLLQMDSGSYGLKARVSLAICNFLDGNFLESKQNILAATKVQEMTSVDFRGEKSYQRYLLNIFKWREDNNFEVYNRKLEKIFYVVGESHSLVSHYLRVKRLGSDLFCKAKLIRGCKQWHLGNTTKNKFKNKFESIFCSLPKSRKCC